MQGVSICSYLSQTAVWPDFLDFSNYAEEVNQKVFAAGKALLEELLEELLQGFIGR